MRSLPLLALVALLGITTPVYGGLELGKKPWFCHGLDCPKYEVVETTDAYEVREYQEGEKWMLSLFELGDEINVFSFHNSIQPRSGAVAFLAFQSWAVSSSDFLSYVAALEVY
jgi:hypothetical protein